MPGPVRPFRVGDRARMRYGLSGSLYGLWLHGVMKPWPEGGPDGLLVVWSELPMVATTLPNPNVEHDPDATTEPSPPPEAA